MKISTIIGLVVSAISILGGLAAFDNYYAHAGDVRQIRNELQQKILEDRIDRTQERIWRIRDRKAQSQDDTDNLRRLEADRDKAEKQLKLILEKAIKE